MIAHAYIPQRSRQREGGRGEVEEVDAVGTTLALLLVAFAPPALAQQTGDLDCSDFRPRIRTQRILLEDSSDPDNLYADKDGIACEELLPPGTKITTAGPSIAVGSVAEEKLCGAETQAKELPRPAARAGYAHAKEAAPLPLREHEKRARALIPWPFPPTSFWLLSVCRFCLLDRLVAVHLQRGLLVNRGTLQINKVVQEVH